MEDVAQFVASYDQGSEAGIRYAGPATWPGRDATVGVAAADPNASRRRAVIDYLFSPSHRAVLVAAPEDLLVALFLGDVREKAILDGGAVHLDLAAQALRRGLCETFVAAWMEPLGMDQGVSLEGVFREAIRGNATTLRALDDALAARLHREYSFTIRQRLQRFSNVLARAAL